MVPGVLGSRCRMSKRVQLNDLCLAIVLCPNLFLLTRSTLVHVFNTVLAVSERAATT